MITIKLKGMEAVRDKLKGLPTSMQNRATKTSVRRACAPVRDEAKRLAPVHREMAIRRGKTVMVKQYPAYRTFLTSKQLTKRMARIDKFEQTYMDKMDTPKAKKAFGRKMARKRASVKKSYQLRKPGTLKRSIIIGDIPNGWKTSMKVVHKGQVVSMGVGLMKRGFYGKFQELGWKHKTSKRGAPGKVTIMPARNFMKTALEKNASRVFSIMTSEMLDELNKVRTKAA